MGKTASSIMPYLQLVILNSVDKHYPIPLGAQVIGSWPHKLSGGVAVLLLVGE